MVKIVAATILRTVLAVAAVQLLAWHAVRGIATIVAVRVSGLGASLDLRQQVVGVQLA